MLIYVINPASSIRAVLCFAPITYTISFFFALNMSVHLSQRVLTERTRGGVSRVDATDRTLRNGC